MHPIQPSGGQPLSQNHRFLPAFSFVVRMPSTGEMRIAQRVEQIVFNERLRWRVTYRSNAGVQSHHFLPLPVEEPNQNNHFASANREGFSMTLHEVQFVEEGENVGWQFHYLTSAQQSFRYLFPVARRNAPAPRPNLPPDFAIQAPQVLTTMREALRPYFEAISIAVLDLIQAEPMRRRWEEGDPAFFVYAPLLALHCLSGHDNDLAMRAAVERAIIEDQIPSDEPIRSQFLAYSNQWGDHREIQSDLFRCVSESLPEISRIWELQMELHRGIPIALQLLIHELLEISLTLSFDRTINYWKNYLIPTQVPPELSSKLVSWCISRDKWADVVLLLFSLQPPGQSRALLQSYIDLAKNGGQKLESVLTLMDRRELFQPMPGMAGALLCKMVELDWLQQVNDFLALSQRGNYAYAASQLRLSVHCWRAAMATALERGRFQIFQSLVNQCPDSNTISLELFLKAASTLNQKTLAVDPPSWTAFRQFIHRFGRTIVSREYWGAAIRQNASDPSRAITPLLETMPDNAISRNTLNQHTAFLLAHHNTPQFVELLSSRLRHQLTGETLEGFIRGLSQRAAGAYQNQLPTAIHLAMNLYHPSEISRLYDLIFSCSECPVRPLFFEFLHTNRIQQEIFSSDARAGEFFRQPRFAALDGDNLGRILYAVRSSNRLETGTMKLLFEAPNANAIPGYAISDILTRGLGFTPKDQWLMEKLLSLPNAEALSADLLFRYLDESSLSSHRNRAIGEKIISLLGCRDLNPLLHYSLYCTSLFRSLQQANRPLFQMLEDKMKQIIDSVPISMINEQLFELSGKGLTSAISHFCKVFQFYLTPLSVQTAISKARANNQHFAARELEAIFEAITYSRREPHGTRSMNEQRIALRNERWQDRLRSRPPFNSYQ